MQARMTVEAQIAAFPALDRGGDSPSHAAVLERAGGVEPFDLEEHPCHARVLGDPRRLSRSGVLPSSRVTTGVESVTVGSPGTPR